jgi:hypothetical protein
MTVSTDVTDTHTQQLQALQEALRALLVPLARLSVARGLPFATVEEMLKQAFVQAASDAHPGLLPHRKVSRISTVTGINRREVTRITQEAQPVRPRGRSLVSELYSHWLSDPRYRGPFGEPLALPRQGPAPSFESLAQEITRDVHPRSLLDEMLRLKLATLDAAADTVLASPDATPSGDIVPMLAFLGENVGDHLSAAVENTLEGPQSHFEQALFASGASADTIDWLHRVVRHQWQGLRAAIVPELERRLSEDGRDTAGASHRLRVGLFSYDDRLQRPASPGRGPAKERS